jgi:hypothetical protein
MLLRYGVFVAASLTFGPWMMAACSSSSSNAPAQCNTNPFACQAGQTCWPQSCVCPSGQKCDTTNCVAQFACLPSAAGKNAHDTCNNQIGTATCGDQQACIELPQAGGYCLAYCDPSSPAHGCPSDELCVSYKVGQGDTAPSVNVCAPLANADGGNPFQVGDGGDFGEGGASDGGTNVGEASFEAGMSQ